MSVNCLEDFLFENSSHMYYHFFIMMSFTIIMFCLSMDDTNKQEHLG
jgi:hypothetical protein